MDRFAGKIVWITGASSGIGEALAGAFAREGAQIVLSSRRADELERVRRGLPRFQGENLQRNLALVAVLEAFAAKKSCAASEIALAWLPRSEEHLCL